MAKSAQKILFLMSCCLLSQAVKQILFSFIYIYIRAVITSGDEKDLSIFVRSRIRVVIIKKICCVAWDISSYKKDISRRFGDKSCYY